MARLLVGDETCAAVAFDGNNLLIATNENTHSEDFIRMRIHLMVKGDRYATNQYEVYPVVYISSSDMIPTRVLVDKSVKYFYSKKHQCLQLTNDSPQKINAILTPAQHLLPSIPDVDVGYHITVKEQIPFTKDQYRDMEQDLSRFGSIEFPTLFNNRVPLNALHRRAEIIVDHLATVSLIEFKGDEMTESDLQKYVSITDNNRKNVLINSLSWEASTWYRKAYNPREPICPEKAGIDKFIKILNDDFSEYYRAHQYNEGKGQTSIVKDWFKLAMHKIKSQEIQAPEFVQNNISKFEKNAEQYFIDLAKLEEFFKHEIQIGSSLAELFLNEGGPLEDKSFIKILDELENGVHAEIRILDYLLQHKIPIEYIATSYLCCAHCKLFMDSREIENISGGHAKAYAQWILPSKFTKDDNLMKIFLGDELYHQLDSLRDKVITMPHNNGVTTKSEIALQIIQNIASLNEPSLEALGLDRIWNNESLLADESDDEREDYYAVQDLVERSEEVVHVGDSDYV